MNKKRCFTIKVIDSFGEFIEAFGVFEEQVIRQLVEKAEQKNMSCLAYIDLSRDTYFNEYQCDDIKEELSILRDNGFDDVLDSLKKAVAKAEEVSGFVKVEHSEL